MRGGEWEGGREEVKKEWSKGEREKEEERGRRRRREEWGWGSTVTLYPFMHTPFPAFPTFQCLRVRQSSLQSSHQHRSAMKGTYIQTCSSCRCR